MAGPKIKYSTAGVPQRRNAKIIVKFLVLLAIWLVAFIPVYTNLVWIWLKHSDHSHGTLEKSDD